MPGTYTEPFSTVCGPDGGVYFTISSGNKIGRIDTASYAINTWTIPTPNSTPKGISLAAKGVCFAESNVNKIGCMPLGGGPITESTVPLRGATPNKLAYGLDGGVWFTQSEISYVARWR